MDGGVLDVGRMVQSGDVARWRKHPRKDLQEVLKVFDAHGWTIEDPPKYYRLTCPCGLHLKWLHLTPSNPNHGREALQWARRTCPMWEETL